jgi:hypothetical protein
MKPNQKTMQELLADGAKWVIEQGRMLKTPQGTYLIPVPNECKSILDYSSILIQTC